MAEQNYFQTADQDKQYNRFEERIRLGKVLDGAFMVETVQIKDGVGSSNLGSWVRSAGNGFVAG